MGRSAVHLVCAKRNQHNIQNVRSAFQYGSVSGRVMVARLRFVRGTKREPTDFPAFCNIICCHTINSSRRRIPSTVFDGDELCIKCHLRDTKREHNGTGL